MRTIFATALALLSLTTASHLRAQTITVGGTITQSTQDGTGPAVNNSALNGIADGDTYTLELDFTGAIAGLGSFNPLPGASLTFTDGAIQEAAFNSVFLTIYADTNPALDDVSLLGCLSTGSGCFNGNSLSVNFSIAAADITSSGASASFIPGLFPPLDLEEDDGVTDIQGAVSSFSNTSAGAATPEPATAFSLCVALALLVGTRVQRLRISRESDLSANKGAQKC